MYVVIAAMFAFAGWLDINTPLGLVLWLLYLGPIWLLSRLVPFDHRLVLLGALTTTVLMSRPLFFSPTGVPSWMAAVNHSIGVILVWIVSLLLVRARRQEAALRLNEARASALVQASAQVLWIAEPDGSVVKDSPSWHAFTGQTFDARKGWGWLNAVHPDDRGRVEAEWRQALATHSPLETEYRLWHREGQYRWTAVRAVPVLNDDGSIGEWVGMHTDISARKQGEEALRDNQERLRLAVDSAELGMWDEACESGQAVWNDRAYALLGITAPFPTAGSALWKQCLHQEDLEAVMESIARAHRERSLYRQEHRIVRRDNSQIRWVSPYGRFLYDDEGRAQRFVGVFSDITERRQAEEALRQSEEQLRVNFDLAAVGQAQVSAGTGCFIRVNDRFCALTGYSREELLAMTPHDLTHPDDRAADDPKVRRLLQGDSEEYYCEKRYLGKRGMHRWVRVSARLIRDAAHRPHHTISVVEDITERKEAEAALMQVTMDLERRVVERTQELTDSQQRLRALASELNLAEQRERRRLASELHDYLAQLLVVGRLKLSQALQKVGASGAREHIQEADEILDRSLTYTRSLVAQLVPPVLEQFGLSAALLWLGDEMRRRGLTVGVEAPRDPPPLSVDQASLLYQSTRELLMNVLKHSRTTDATVTLTCEDPDDLTIVVQDQGAGFDLKSSAHTPMNKFGLFSIRERMQALGGTFALESAPGKGTRATLRLPLGAAQETVTLDRPEAPGVTAILTLGHPAPVAERGRRAATHKTATIRVLLVDDHAMVREGLRSILHGYADIDVVGEAGDGEEAIEQAKDLSPNVIVMDVNMPKLDGIEATRRIRHSCPETAIIGLSVNASQQVVDAMREAGALTLLTKESAAELLYQTIARTARRSGLPLVDSQEPLPFMGECKERAEK